MEKGVMAIDVLIRRGMKNQDCCLLLTKDCIVLVPERSRDEIRPGVFGYASFHVREHDHPSAENLERTTQDEKNLVIPYDRLRRIYIHRGFSSSTMRREYIILLNYLDMTQKERKVSAVLTSPRESSGRIAANRLNRTVATEYAMEVKGMLTEALPAGLVVIAGV